MQTGPPGGGSEKGFIWKLKLSESSNFNQLIREISQVNADFLVDFEKETSLKTVVNCLEKMSQLFANKPVFFENWVFQRVWDVEYRNKLFSPLTEHIVRYNLNLEVSHVFVNKDELLIDALEFLIMKDFF